MSIQITQELLLNKKILKQPIVIKKLIKLFPKIILL